MKKMVVSILILIGGFCALAKKQSDRKPDQVIGDWGKQLTANIGASSFSKKLAEAGHVCVTEKRVVVLTLSQGETIDEELLKEANNAYSLCLYRVEKALPAVGKIKDSGTTYELLNAAGWVCVAEKNALESLLSESPLDTGKIKTTQKIYEGCRSNVTQALTKIYQ